LAVHGQRWVEGLNEETFTGSTILARSKAAAQRHGATASSLAASIQKPSDDDDNRHDEDDEWNSGAKQVGLG
jgi:hypothetical protein